MYSSPNYPFSNSPPEQIPDELFGRSLTKRERKDLIVDTLQKEVDFPVFGAVQIGDYIAYGGFGIVYKAYSQKYKSRIFAIKQIVVTDQEQMNQTLRDIDILYDLKDQDECYEGISCIYDHAIYEDMYRGKYPIIYILMEYIQGLDLETLIHQKPEMVRFYFSDIFEQCVTYLTYIHSKGYIHRDFRSANIMFTLRDQKPQIKIIDFGLFCDANECEKPYGGTNERYWEPFNLSMNCRESDVFSLGISLYEILFQEVPYQQVSTMMEKKSKKQLSRSEYRRLILNSYEKAKRMIKKSSISKLHQNLLKLMIEPTGVGRISSRETLFLLKQGIDLSFKEIQSMCQDYKTCIYNPEIRRRIKKIE